MISLIIYLIIGLLNAIVWLIGARGNLTSIEFLVIILIWPYFLIAGVFCYIISIEGIL